MVILLWDASALSKRYAPEIGRETVTTLVASIPASQRVTTFLGYAEIHSVLIRKLNRGDIDRPTYRAALSALQDEVIDDVDFGVLEVESSAILAGIGLIERHNLNASDAAILITFLRYAQIEGASGNRCGLIAADRRLARAAEAEGLKTLNPEVVAAADVPAFLAAL